MWLGPSGICNAVVVAETQKTMKAMEETEPTNQLQGPRHGHHGLA